ncbi:MAG: T9SS type A sorting domain-containing protein [Saprospiraceae bacterium]|nr:T9SS type A sorting domain-containing protein [Saprospiraceae bacterium]
MKNSTNWIKKILCLSLIFIKFSVGSFFAQDCSPDVVAPFLSVKSNYTVYLDIASEYNLRAEEMVSLCIDNCTPPDKMRYSFSEVASDNEKKIQRNTNFPLDLAVFAIDQAGNIAKAIGKISISTCTQTLVCNDALKFSIQKGGSLPLSVDQFLEGSYCRDHIFEISYYNGSIFLPIVQIDESLPRLFQYRVEDSVTGNYCWGEVSYGLFGVCDPEGEFKFSNNSVTTNCIQDADPRDVGYPFPTHYKVEQTGSLQTYDVEYNPACPRISVSYTDQLVTKECNDPNTAEITRIWTAIFPGGSNKQFTQLVKFERTLNGIFSNLHNYDGLDLPKLNCKDKWPRKDGFIPVPEFTGRPISNSCIRMEAKYNDLIIPVGPTPCGEDYKIIRTWTVVNWCSGEIYNHNQVFKIYCGTDTIPPVAICNEKATFAVPSSGEVTLFPEMLDNASFDNCGGLSFSFDKEEFIKSLKFNILDAGKTMDVTLFVTDLSGNQTSCIVTVNFVFKGNGPNTKNIIGGKLLNYNLESIGVQNNFNFNLNDELNIIPLYACGEPVNFSNLDYSLCIDTANNTQSGFLIPGVKVPNVRSGVTTFDIVQIIKNLLGVLKFNSYQAIAADADCDNKITIFDIFDLRRLVLGITNKLSCDDVQFYSDNIAKPQLIKEIKLQNLPRFDYNIVPVKKGDINGNGIFVQNPIIEVRSGEKFSFFVDNFNVRIDQTYDIWVRSAEEYKVYGVQIGQLFDEKKIEILDITSPLLNLVKESDYTINEGGDWRCLLINPNISLMTISGGFLKIRVRSKFEGMVNEAMSSTHFPIPLFVISSDIELSIPTLESKAITSTADEKIGNLGYLNVFPNPFNDNFKIELDNESVGAIMLEIYTLEGKKLFQNTYFVSSAKNYINMNAKLFPGAGVYLMVLNNGSRIYKKLLIKK